MANNYFDMTGVLVLRQVTPVIRALFSAYNLDENHPGNGEAYIAAMSETDSSPWDSVIEELEELAGALGAAVVPGEGAESCLSALASHFKVEGNADLLNMIEHTSFEDEAGMEQLFLLARLFDDGHGLKAYKTEAAWTCSRPRLFEFGGCGTYAGQHVHVTASSSSAMPLGEQLDANIAAGDLDKAAEALCTDITGVLAGIYDEQTRLAVRARLANLLA